MLSRDGDVLTCKLCRSLRGEPCLSVCSVTDVSGLYIQLVWYGTIPYCIPQENVSDWGNAAENTHKTDLATRLEGAFRQEMLPKSCGEKKPNVWHVVCASTSSQNIRLPNMHEQRVTHVLPPTKLS